MGRGLDGYIFGTRSLAGCAVLKARGPDKFPVAIAWGKHLFPFRTEQLSPTAPMVLGPHGPGRVGRRRFFLREPPVGGSSSLSPRLRRLFGRSRSRASGRCSVGDSSRELGRGSVAARSSPPGIAPRGP